jgi:hypothetical protein
MRHIVRGSDDFSKDFSNPEVHDDHAWSPNATPPARTVPVIGSPEDAKYIAVDEEHGTCQKLPENPGRSPCNHFAKFGWCPLAKICRHAHRGGKSITANLRGFPIRPGKKVLCRLQPFPSSTLHSQKQRTLVQRKNTYVVQMNSLGTSPFQRYILFWDDSSLNTQDQERL